VSVSRREALGAFAWASLLATPSLAFAAEGKRKIYTPPGIDRDLPTGAGNGKRFTIARTTPFDLSDPRDVAIARLKATVNLDGRKAWLSSLTRHYLCPPNRQPVPFVNELELFSMFLEESPAGPVQRSVFTRTYCDPKTHAPTDHAVDPFTGRTLELGDVLFAVTTPVRLENEMRVRNVVENAPEPFDFGTYVDFISLAVRNGEGPHQPSFDASVWRVQKKGLQDPSRPLISAHYSFSALLRAAYMPWTGYPNDDATQVLTAKAGVKVTAEQDLPPRVVELLVKRYPERV
jgi:hypothetical protein